MNEVGAGHGVLAGRADLSAPVADEGGRNG